MDGGERICENGKEDESLGDHILEEMESFLLDIDERLTISRMVSDSVIKGMVNAVEEQAAERIAQKELEVVGLKKMLQNCHVGSDETKTSWSSVHYHEPHEAATPHFLDSFREQDGLIKSVDSLKIELISYGSLENTEEWCHNKRADHFHVKLSTDHLSPSPLEENGKQDDSKIIKPEDLDSALLKHMSKDELVTYITKMRRNHESQVQEKTEENFRLRRELLNLKERGSSFPLKKDKDFDLLKKKIADVISKLNEVLVGDEKLSAAVEKLSQQQLTEQKLLQTIQKLEDDVGDAHAEVSIIQDVYKCLFEDMTSEFRCITEELHLKYSFMQEIYEVIVKEIQSAQASNQLEIEEAADSESTMLQGLLDINHIIFKEALVDADEALKLEAAEKEKLNYEMLMLKSIVKEKDTLIQEAADALVQEKQRMESASEQLDSLKAKAVQQHNLIVKNSQEMDVTKGDLNAALKEIEQYKEQMHKLHQNLEQKMNELREIDEERRELYAVTQKQQDALKLVEAKERESRKQMESTINLIHKLLTMVTDFEARVNEDISRNCLRLENMGSEFCCLNNKVKVLKTRGLVYKQKFETRCSDLAKAEAEPFVAPMHANALEYN
ncbi:putative WPP domain-associated protein isoform X1 [Sesbania bispinosa]|nr:putative WPP domain-associated protein isoform X1 [Sesbania bispinosa]